MRVIPKYDWTVKRNLRLIRGSDFTENKTAQISNYTPIYIAFKTDKKFRDDEPLESRPIIAPIDGIKKYTYSVFIIIKKTILTI